MSHFYHILCGWAFAIAALHAQPTTMHPSVFCDPATGLCTLEPLAATTDTDVQPLRDGVAIVYVGDPLCSWCWGISPALQELRLRAAAVGIPFRIVVGGLRPGGGDAWTPQFHEFLRHHWEEVHDRSGQPFSYGLFEREAFNYDTEPSCRAVVTARTMNPAAEHRFFERVQHHFYVQNEDPTQVAFYKPISEALALDFPTFARLFDSEEMKAATRADFSLCRSWGVRGYPTVLLQQDNQLQLLASGYTTFDALWANMHALLNK